MKKIISTVLLLLSAVAQGQGVQHAQQVFNACAAQMFMGVCRPQNDGAQDRPGARMVIPGVGDFSMKAYREFTRRAEPNPQSPAFLAMCEFGREQLIAAPASEEAQLADVLWPAPPQPEPRPEQAPVAQAGATADMAVAIVATTLYFAGLALLIVFAFQPPVLMRTRP